MAMMFEDFVVWGCFNLHWGEEYDTQITEPNGIILNPDSNIVQGIDTDLT